MCTTVIQMRNCAIIYTISTLSSDGVDFVAEEIELLFPSSSSGGRACANITIIDDAIALEGTEQFFINFTYIIPDFDLPKTINSSFIGSNSEACVTIVDDDEEGWWTQTIHQQFNHDA